MRGLVALQILAMTVTAGGQALAQVQGSQAAEAVLSLYQRLSGERPSSQVLEQMVALWEQGDREAAARLALNTQGFYDLTLRSFASRMSNFAQSSRVGLNDATATMIGIIRDDLPWSSVLTGEWVYVGGASISPVYSPAPQVARNHFVAIENSAGSLRELLVQRSQSSFRSEVEPAGVLTTQAWAQEGFEAGTNRRVFMGMVRHFWCREMEDLHDNSVPAIRVRRDVDRSPAGAPQVYQAKCTGCHAVMDAAIGGASFYDYSEQNGISYRRAQVSSKMNQNGDVYPQGFVTSDDSWMFLGGLSASRSFERIGWRGATSGRGLKTFAEAFSQSRAFSECAVRRVVRQTCLREPSGVELRALTERFEEGGRYNMKDLFVAATVRCVGGQ